MKLRGQTLLVPVESLKPSRVHRRLIVNDSDCLDTVLGVNRLDFSVLMAYAPDRKVSSRSSCCKLSS